METHSLKINAHTDHSYNRPKGGSGRDQEYVNFPFAVCLYATLFFIVGEHHPSFGCPFPGLISIGKGRPSEGCQETLPTVTSLRPIGRVTVGHSVSWEVLEMVSQRSHRRYATFILWCDL